ncbi:helix-turn-helix domain-containing protein [Eggerthellaceae bacterium zg-887]|nr:helix-turn-helix domain-containing protein [Xiamenia xianingshaonis]
MEPQTTIGRNLRLYRKRAGLTQEELANRCHMHRTYIGGIEQQRINVSINNVGRIASVLGIDPFLLLVEPFVDSGEQQRTPLSVPEVVLPPGFSEGDLALCHWDKNGLELTPLSSAQPDLALRILVALAMQGRIDDLPEAYEAVKDRVVETFFASPAEAQQGPPEPPIGGSGGENPTPTWLRDEKGAEPAGPQHVGEKPAATSQSPEAEQAGLPAQPENGTSAARQ